MPSEPTPAEILAALQRGFGHLESRQTPRGDVTAEMVWNPMITAQYAMTAFLLRRPVADDRRAAILRYLERSQAADGGYGLHAESGGYVYVTALAYVAMRLLGLPAEDARCARARAWLAAQGGVLGVPSWGKAWLAMMGLYGWEGVAPILPELWLLPDWAPVHPRLMYSHTRLIYLALGYLWGVRLQAPPDGIVLALRRELYAAPYATIDFRRHRYDLARSDTYERPHPALRLAYELSGAYDRVRIRALRERALQRCIAHIAHHQRESGFAAISPVNGLLYSLALAHAGHPDAEASFQGVDYWVIRDAQDGERLAGAHSHTWDTAFTVQALVEGPAAAAHPRLLEGAARYLRDQQIRTEDPAHRRFYADPREGGFCFSDAHHRWPVSDCTAEALSALVLLAPRVPADLRPAAADLASAVRFVLTRQNGDGGWGSYERRRGGVFLERFNPSEMFGNCMVEHSYVECTGSCLVGLRHALGTSALGEAERRAAARALRRGAEFLRRAQRREGAWPGFWGVHWTYGTLFGVSGLLAAGVPAVDPALRRACRWLLSARLPDGGWGESFRGCVEQRYVPHARSQVIMTAWALMTLLRAGADGPEARAAIAAGARLLLDRQLPGGDWPEEGVAGVFFNTAMLHYRLYKDYFSLWALGLLARRDGAGT